jgi:hypothetical protein
MNENLEVIVGGGVIVASIIFIIVEEITYKEKEYKHEVRDR